MSLIELSWTAKNSQQPSLDVDVFFGRNWDHFMETWRPLCDHFANRFLWHIRRLTKKFVNAFTPRLVILSLFKPNQLSENLKYQWYQELTYGNLVPTGIKLKIKGLL